MGKAGVQSKQTVAHWRSSSGHQQDKQLATFSRLQNDFRSSDGDTTGTLQETLQGRVSQEVLEGEFDFSGSEFSSYQCACSYIVWTSKCLKCFVYYEVNERKVLCLGALWDWVWVHIQVWSFAETYTVLKCPNSTGWRFECSSGGDFHLTMKRNWVSCVANCRCQLWNGDAAYELETEPSLFFYTQHNLIVRPVT